LNLSSYMNPTSTWKAIRDEKCPRCHQGNLFVTSVYNLKSFYQMHRYCPRCEQTLEPEPGFYFGAMFVSYGMVVIMSIVSWIVLFFVFDPVFAVYLIVILILNVLLLPFIFRYSRTLYLFGFGSIKFKENIINE